MLAPTLTLLLSSFLLCLLQPLLAKQILPWFGGSAGVWTVCLTFFQVVLVLGYAYAHRFAERAASLGKPLAAVNLGRTRADALLMIKAEEPCESALSFLLGSRATSGSIQPARLKQYSSSAFVSPAEPERSREQHGADD